MSDSIDNVAVADPVLRPMDWAAALTALVVECSLIAAYHTERLPLMLALLGHLSVALLLLLRYSRRIRAGQDGSGTMLLAFVVLVAGPFGALGGLLIGWLARPERSTQERLSDWYDRISLSTDLSATTRRSDRILTGRVANMDAPVPQSFVGVLEHGRVREQQVVLGLIARRFHPDYLPVLSLALVSDEPVIRVQAAAVAAKVRVELAARADAALAAAEDADHPIDEVLRNISEVEKYVACGLMEEADTRRATLRVERLLSSLTERLQRTSPARRAAIGSMTIEHVEARLLAGQRFAEFRRLRRERFWLAKGAHRFRPIQRRGGEARMKQEPAPHRGAAE